jgi:hypothetical protein
MVTFETYFPMKRLGIVVLEKIYLHHYSAVQIGNQ